MLRQAGSRAINKLTWLSISGGAVYVALFAGLCAAADSVPGDADCNGVLDSADLPAVVAAIFEGTTCSTSDANDDGSLTAADLPAEVELLKASLPTQTETPSVAPTVTGSPNDTATPTVSLSPTVSPTPTISRTPTITDTPTITPTPSITPTITRTPTVTQTPTISRTPTSTGTETPPFTVTPTETPTRTPTVTPTTTLTGTQTATASQTPPFSPTGTATVTPPPPPTFTGTPTGTPTTMFAGPLVTFFGVVNSNGCSVECPTCDQPAGCPPGPTPTPILVGSTRVFLRAPDVTFLVIVEGGGSVGTNLSKLCSAERPDVQVESSRGLGNGTPSSCPSPTPGFHPGVPGFLIPDFGPSTDITIALQEFASRFAVLQGTTSACTKDAGGNDNFMNPSSAVQFCGEISTATAFPPGDTLLTVQLRDSAKNIGPTAQIIVRLPTVLATPTPPATSTPTLVPTLTPS